MTARRRHPVLRRSAACLAAAGLLLLAAACSNGEGGGGGGQTAKTEEFTQIVIETAQGDIRFEMLQTVAPVTVNTMAALVLDGTYDDKRFFQRKEGAFVQFGDPDAETSLLATPIAQEITGEPLDRGMVALAWVGSRERTSHRLIFPLARLDNRLDTQFTVFGRVLEGMDVLDQLAEGAGIQRITTRLQRPLVRIVTQKGSIIMELKPSFAPQTVERISDLVCQAFYDGLTFHRVEDVLIQGGDPNGDGTGGTGTTIPAEINDGRFFRGSVGMARQADDINSADSQFFIMKEQVAEFDSAYTYFAEVIGGMEVVDQIEVGDVMSTVTLEFDLQGRDCQATDAPPPDDAGPSSTPPPVTT